MPDLKVLVGGRNYNISCNPGEEIAAQESAQLLDQQAELIQNQLGRLAEDKMLLLSGLLLGDKVRALKHERNALEETLRVTQEKLNELSANDEKTYNTSNSNARLLDKTGKEEESKFELLQTISNLLDGVIEQFDKPNRNTDKNEGGSTVNQNNQGSFL